MTTVRPSSEVRHRHKLIFCQFQTAEMRRKEQHIQQFKLHDCSYFVHIKQYMTARNYVTIQFGLRTIANPIFPMLSTIRGVRMSSGLE